MAKSQTSFTPVVAGNDIIDKMGIKTSMNTEHVYIYENGYYTFHNSIPKIRQKISEFLGTGYKKYKVEEVLSYIKDNTLFDLPSMDDSTFICLKNGILETVTGLKIEDNKKHFLTYQLPVEYNQELDAAPIEEYVKTLVSDSEMVDTLQEFIGYALVPHQFAKKLLFTYGDRDSGKSSFYIILTKFFSEVNTSTLSLQQICQKFTNAELYGKLANIRADMDYRMKPSSVGIIKSLTGDDYITAERKFKDPFSFRNQAKIFLSANGVPALPEEVDDAFYKRWLPIEFPYRFTSTNKDVQLVEKFTTPEMLSRILNWALEGLTRLRKNKWVFTYNPTVEQIKEWFRDGMIYNNVEKFVSEYCLPYPNEYVLKDELYEQYEKWCKAKLSPVLENNAFHRKVKNNRIHTVEEFRPRIEDTQLRAWKGVKLLKKNVNPTR